MNFDCFHLVRLGKLSRHKGEVHVWTIFLFVLLSDFLKKSIFLLCFDFFKLLLD